VVSSENEVMRGTPEVGTELIRPPLGGALTFKTISAYEYNESEVASFMFAPILNVT
jgi:hypothetical protein